MKTNKQTNKHPNIQTNTLTNKQTPQEQNHEKTLTTPESKLTRNMVTWDLTLFFVFIKWNMSQINQDVNQTYTESW